MTLCFEQFDEAGDRRLLEGRPRMPLRRHTRNGVHGCPRGLPFRWRPPAFFRFLMGAVVVCGGLLVTVGCGKPCSDLATFEIKSDGTGKHRVHPHNDRPVALSQTSIESPGGDRIAFIRKLSPSDPEGRLYVKSKDGGQQRLISRQPATLLGWSPDGRKIAFRGTDGLYVANANGRGQQLIPAGSPYVFAWSPDSQRLAVQDGDNVVIYTAKGELVRTLASGDLIFSVAWAPSQTITYTQELGNQYQSKCGD